MAPPSESQMAASPTGNIRSFCSEDALGWLIQTSKKKKKKLWWGFFSFFFTLSSHARAKLPMSRGGFCQGAPTGGLKLGEKPALSFIDSPPFWSLETIRRLNISSAPHVWTESCTLVLAVSLQTRPTANINKVIIWARQDSLDWESGGGWAHCSGPLTEQSGNSNCHVSLFFGGKTIVCLWTLLHSFMGSLVLLVPAGEVVFSCYYPSLLFAILHM